jgi:hypothetical protein
MTKVLSYAPTGSAAKVASSPHTQPGTSAQAAGAPITELNPAPLPKTPTISSPYIPENWASLLDQFGLTKDYPSFINNLKHGFTAGIPAITSTLAPYNHPSLVQYVRQFNDIMLRELDQGRYFGPFSTNQVTEMIGPFQTSPMSIIPKPGKPGKYRLIQNFSHPYNSSLGPMAINAHINPADFPCTWGTFSTVAQIIAHLPEGSEAATRDVKEAYRTVPVHPSQWPGMVVRLPGQDSFAIDTRDAFGLSSGAGLYRKIADVGLDIMRASGLGPITKWVDDHLFFRIRREHLQRYNSIREEAAQNIKSSQGRVHRNGRIWYRGNLMPTDKWEEFGEDMKFPLADLGQDAQKSAHDNLFTYSMDDIDKLSQRLGIPWEKEKDQPFDTKTTFIGLEWDLQQKRVSIPDKKRLKYLNEIKVWQRSRTHDLAEAQKLHGKLLHACLVITKGKAYLRSLEAFLSIFHDKPFLKRTPPHRLYEDLQWWRETLTEPRTISRLIPGIRPVVDLGAFSDASSEVGIGIIIGEKWRAWRLLPGWKGEGRDIGWAEALGFLFLITTATRLSRAADIRVYGDNKGVVEGWWKGRSRNPPTNDIFKLIHDMASQLDINIYTRYVPSKQNPADVPSRGVYGSKALLLPLINIPAQYQHLVVNYDAPRNKAEVDLMARNALPLPKPKPAAEQNIDRSDAPSGEEDLLLTYSTTPLPTQIAHQDTELPPS